MVRSIGLCAVGALVLGAALNPGRLADRANAHPFAPPLEVDMVAPIPVRIYEYGFQPSRLVILTGQAVVWRNIGEELHIVAPTTASGGSVWQRAERLGTVRHLFTHPGSYPYRCSIHHRMRGVIVVRARDEAY